MPTPEPEDRAGKRNVFVVHGRNEPLRRSMFDFLRAIGLNPIEWTKAIAMTGKGSPFIGDVIDHAMEKAQAIVVLFTGDDEAKLKEEFQSDHDPDYERELTPQARPNVLFEAGMAFGKYPDRTILVQAGLLRPFSDIAGRHMVIINDSIKARQDLALRLQNAGCSVELSGVDWHSAGKFSVTRKRTGKIKGTEPKPENKNDLPLIEKVSQESNLPVGALKVLLAFTYAPKYLSDQIKVETLAQVTGSNPLRTKKDCELLESMGLVKRGVVNFNDGVYSLTDQGEAFLLKTGLI